MRLAVCCGQGAQARVCGTHGAHQIGLGNGGGLTVCWQHRVQGWRATGTGARRSCAGAWRTRHLGV